MDLKIEYKLVENSTTSYMLFIGKIWIGRMDECEDLMDNSKFYFFDLSVDEHDEEGDNFFLTIEEGLEWVKTKLYGTSE